MEIEKEKTASPDQPADPGPAQKPAQADQPATSEAPLKPPEKPADKRRWKFVILGVLAVMVLIVGIPRIIHALHTASTDDAYVNCHVTFVAPRVAGQVARVLVDDNNRVKKGDVLVELDPEPYRVQVAIKQAAVDAAQANLVVAEATVRSQAGQARSLRFKLQHTIEDVDNQIAVLRARAATLDQARASLALAQAEFDRASKLRLTKVTSAEEFDQKRETFDVAKAQVQQAQESVYQQRVALGLPREPEAGQSLTDVPPDLDQTFSGVSQALFELRQAAAQVGIVASSYSLTPKELLAEFSRRHPSGDIDRIFADIIKNAPGLKQAQAKLEEAQRDLDQANLDLRYCTIVAEIDGVVTRRNLNPGDNVQVGQSLMAIRSLREVWVDANFKETQLRDLRIGQHVDLDVDMYGGKRKFEGRISGFTMGTGSTLALLPPQNATGNYVKVVQRLPVRIDVLNYDPDKAPLFVGLSVEPTVDLKAAPTGPNAGRFLQETIQPSPAPKP